MITQLASGLTIRKNTPLKRITYRSVFLYTIRSLSAHYSLQVGVQCWN